MKVFISTVPFSDHDRRPLCLLSEAGVDAIINPLGRKLKEQELADQITDCDVIIAGTEPITDYVMERATKLKLIVRVGIGLDSVDLLAARRRGIRISYTPDAPSPAVAEMTIGLMITLLRSIHLSNNGVHQGKWFRYFGRRLSEITVGIIGVGRIGSRVIRHLAGFNCPRIMINDIDSRVELPDYPGCTIDKADKETIYKEADIISLHVPLTAATRNMVTKKELSMMKRDAMVVNTARGGIIREQDLFEILKLGHLGGAAIDVFEEEPYSGNLSTIERCLMTAHMGSMAIDCRTRMEIEATEEVIRFISQQPLESAVPEGEYDNRRTEQ